MRLFFLLLLGFAVVLASGCASSREAEDLDRVSTIPWNRPEKWEGQGPLGGFNQGR